MGRFRVLFVSGAALSLSTVLLALSACGGRAPTGPPSFTITATALNPSSVTAANPSTSAITLMPANGYTGSVSLSCKNTIGGTPAPTCSFSVSPVVISGTSPGTSMMMMTTSSNTPVGSYAIPRLRKGYQRSSSKQRFSGSVADDSGRYPARCGHLSGEPHP